MSNSYYENKYINFDTDSIINDNDSFGAKLDTESSAQLDDTNLSNKNNETKKRFRSCRVDDLSDSRPMVPAKIGDLHVLTCQDTGADGN